MPCKKLKLWAVQKFVCFHDLEIEFQNVPSKLEGIVHKKVIVGHAF